MIVVNFTAVQIGFLQDYEVTEGINSTVTVEIALLDGELSRDAVVNFAVFTSSDSASGMDVNCNQGILWIIAADVGVVYHSIKYASNS